MCIEIFISHKTIIYHNIFDMKIPQAPWCTPISSVHISPLVLSHLCRSHRYTGSHPHATQTQLQHDLHAESHLYAALK